MSDSGLSDEQIDACIEDPLLITSRDDGLAIIDTLNAEIANIQAQIDVATVEAQANALTDDRLDWLRRAAFAKSMRIQERDKVYRRCKHLRFFKGPTNQDPGERSQEKLAKQERLQVEAEARRAAKVADAEKHKTRQMELAQQRRALEADHQRSLERRFVDVARTILPEDIFKAIWAEVHREDIEP